MPVAGLVAAAAPRAVEAAVPGARRAVEAAVPGARRVVEAAVPLAEAAVLAVPRGAAVGQPVAAVAQPSEAAQRGATAAAHVPAEVQASALPLVAEPGGLRLELASAHLLAASRVLRRSASPAARPSVAPRERSVSRWECQGARRVVAGLASRGSASWSACGPAAQTAGSWSACGPAARTAGSWSACGPAAQSEEAADRDERRFASRLVMWSETSSTSRRYDYSCSDCRSPGYWTSRSTSFVQFADRGTVAAVAEVACGSALGRNRENGAAR